MRFGQYSIYSLASPVDVRDERDEYEQSDAVAPAHVPVPAALRLRHVVVDGVGEVRVVRHERRRPPGEAEQLLLTLVQVRLRKQGEEAVLALLDRLLSGSRSSWEKKFFMPKARNESNNR